MSDIPAQPERDLSTLLKDLSVTRLDGEWMFVSRVDAEMPTGAVMAFREREGWTYILPTDDETPDDQRFSWLEVSVFSDLQAVGFLAALSSALAKAGIPCNAVAGFHHDHIFVPVEKAYTALEALRKIP